MLIGGTRDERGISVNGRIEARGYKAGGGHRQHRVKNLGVLVLVGDVVGVVCTDGRDQYVRRRHAGASSGARVDRGRHC